MLRARRIFVAAGLALLAAPGWAAYGLSWPVVAASGLLAGCIAAAVVR